MIAENRIIVFTQTGDQYIEQAKQYFEHNYNGIEIKIYECVLPDH